jgi:hypothetical protein
MSNNSLIERLQHSVSEPQFRELFEAVNSWPPTQEDIDMIDNVARRFDFNRDSLVQSLIEYQWNDDTENSLCFTSPHCDCGECITYSQVSQSSHHPTCKCVYCFDSFCECRQCEVIRNSVCVCTCYSCQDDSKWKEYD